MPDCVCSFLPHYFPLSFPRALSLSKTLLLLSGPSYFGAFVLGVCLFVCFIPVHPVLLVCVSVYVGAGVLTGPVALPLKKMTPLAACRLTMRGGAL